MDSKEKFTHKVSNYVKYRPTYPAEFINYLAAEVGLSGKVVADVGAGTGILTKLLAPRVEKLYAVEPNFNMRWACEEYCSEHDNVVCVNGGAEDSTLAGNSVDFITVAQAFHWFDREKTKVEFGRILKKNEKVNGGKVNGKVIIVRNNKVEESTFIKENEELCRRLCPEFNGGKEINPKAYSDFFKDGCCEYKVFENDRLLTLEEFIGFSLSSSYAPSEKDGNYKEFIDGLKHLFDKYSINGSLLYPTKTHSYVGEIHT